MRPRRSPNGLSSIAVMSIILVSLLGACTTDSEPPAATNETTSTAATSAAPQSAPETTEPPEPAASPSDDGEATDEAAAATRTMFATITPDLPGCTVAAARGGEVVFAEAYGAARLDGADRVAPMTVDTVVDIGSTSKQFTATALLLLAERGEVDLDAPLSSVLDDLPDWADLPTMRQVMHHESGIPDYITLLVDRGFSVSEVATDADALDALAEVTELDFEPGTSWAYSNSNYFLMGQVVLAVTGDDLGTFLADEVFGPLDLVMVMDPTAVIAEKAISYGGEGDQRIVADSPWQQLGDGAIQTTPTQLVRWASEYWAPELELTIDDRLDRAPVPAGLPGDGVYGAGIFALDDDELGRVLRHSGGWGGFVTAFAVAPELEVAIAATCTSPESAASLVATGDPELELLRIWADTAA